MPASVDCLDETTVAMFLDRRLPGDRVSSIEEHIDHCNACRRVISELARHTATTGTALPQAKCVDRYVLLRVLGSGGMGTVYAAYDPTLDRNVAVKVLRSASASAESRARLVHEAQAMARMSSPNVVTVFDAGTFEDQVFVSMELVPGGTLTAWLREQRRSWREIVSTFEAAGRGIAAAHANGIVHRDFKPDNVLVDGDRVRVADFGLAAPIAGDDMLATTSPVDRSLTITGAIAGTPAYMAPEQLEARSCDARSDQFSFCVALYEALYGDRPFGGATIEELRAEVRAGRVRTPPRTAAPRWLRVVVLRGLAVDPAARFGSMAALLIELGRYRSRTWRWALAAVAAVALTTAGWSMRSRGTEPSCRFDNQLDDVWGPPARKAVEAAFRTAGLTQAAEVEHALDEYARGWLRMRSDSCEATYVRGDQSEHFSKFVIDEMVQEQVGENGVRAGG